MFDMKLYEEKLNKANVGDALLSQNLKKEPYIIINDKSDFNNPYNYEIIKTNHAGGVGVIFPLDLGFTWITSKQILPKILNDISTYLQNKNIPICGQGNDILVNDQKLFGTMFKKLEENIFYEGLFFSFNSDINIIKKICKKEMIKKPIGLSEFKVTPEEIIKLCQSLIKKYGLKEVE